MRRASISINFDSLAEAYGYPAGFDDPSYTRVADRFMALADRFALRYTIFVIGRDLEQPASRARVREWARLGHEIANHSWSHPAGFGGMSRAQIRQEVERAHAMICDATGVAPVGFTAPGWMVSRYLFEALVELNYEYDASIAPSWLMLAAVAKMLANHVGDPRFFRILRRRDYPVFLAGPRHAFLTGGALRPMAHPQDNGAIVSLPLPTNGLRVACWHTLAFVLGPAMFRRLLASCLRESGDFYYVVHPADLVDSADLDSSRVHCLERIELPLARKQAILEDAVGVIRGACPEIVPMRDLARAARARLAAAC